MWNFLKQLLILKWCLLSHRQSNREIGKESPGFHCPGSRSLLTRPPCPSYKSTVCSNTELENVILWQTNVLFCLLWSLFLFCVPCIITIFFSSTALLNLISSNWLMELLVKPCLVKEPQNWSCHLCSKLRFNSSVTQVDSLVNVVIVGGEAPMSNQHS